MLPVDPVSGRHPERPSVPSLEIPRQFDLFAPAVHQRGDLTIQMLLHRPEQVLAVLLDPPPQLLVVPRDQDHHRLLCGPNVRPDEHVRFAVHHVRPCFGAQQRADERGGLPVRFERGEDQQVSPHLVGLKSLRTAPLDREDPLALRRPHGPFERLTEHRLKGLPVVRIAKHYDLMTGSDAVRKTAPAAQEGEDQIEEDRERGFVHLQKSEVRSQNVCFTDL